MNLRWPVGCLVLLYRPVSVLEDEPPNCYPDKSCIFRDYINCDPSAAHTVPFLRDEPANDGIPFG
jgi:hypothetical protein